MPQTELDIEREGELVAYLRRTGRVDPDESVEIRRLSGGVSNRTVLVVRGNGDAWVLKQALRKLRVPVEWFASPERTHREAAGLRWLQEVAPAGSVPRFVFEDREHNVLAMEAVPEPHENWKTQLLDGRVEPRHVEAFARLLAAIHRAGRERRAVAAWLFGDRSFFESLRLESYYGYTASRAPRAAKFLRGLIGETLRVRDTVVHGDYSPKNVLLHGERLVLLDHEVIHVGDPTFDLGFSMAHFLSKAHHLPERRGEFAGAVARYWDTYRDAAGEAVRKDASSFEARVVRQTLGCLMARAAGRSQLEYLSETEKTRQLDAAAALGHALPLRVDALTAGFLEKVEG